jgi:cytochrome P450
MYPPAMAMNRQCTKNYQMPGSDLKLEAGIIVHIPVYALHRDPQYWPEPDRFDPERFTEGNKKNRTPYTYMPFGEGPRICIGEFPTCIFWLLNLFNQFRNEIRQCPDEGCLGHNHSKL